MSPGKFQLKKARNGQFHFNLLASNGQVVGQSQQYASRAGADQGCESVRRHAPEAVLSEEVSTP